MREIEKLKIYYKYLRPQLKGSEYNATQALKTAKNIDEYMGMMDVIVSINTLCKAIDNIDNERKDIPKGIVKHYENITGNKQ